MYTYICVYIYIYTHMYIYIYICIHNTTGIRSDVYAYHYGRGAIQSAGGDVQQRDDLPIFSVIVIDKYVNISKTI